MEWMTHERQRRVDRMLQAVGGYWQPYAGVLRLLEELGEFTEELAKQDAGQGNYRGLSEEMADIWIITTAVANQFNIKVPELGGNPRVAQGADGRDPADDFQQLIMKAGHIARAVNYYDGPKTPRTLADWQPLRILIPSLHTTLCHLAARYRIDLDATIDTKLARVADLDRGRFEESYNPSTAEVLDSFIELQRESPCRFAVAARLWGGPAWIPVESIETNVQRLVPFLRTFVKAAPLERLDGFVVGIPQSAGGTSMKDLAKLFGNLLAALAADDPKAEDIFNDDILRVGWQFSFMGLRMFISVFSPVYDPSHPRHSHGSSFVFFQPECSFTEHGIGSGSSSSEELRQAVRERFGAAEKSYPAELIDQRLEARLYLLPRWPGDADCEWWR